MATNPFSGKYELTQSWEEHLINAGPMLGGEDYAMAVGTPLPVLAGVLEWVTPSTASPPRWYNIGLGNAAAYRRTDNTRTVYAHCSTVRLGVVLSGNTGKVRGDGHVHTHDVLADGFTRARPFSTFGTGGAGGGGIPINLGDEEVTYGIRNDFPDEAILPGLPKGATLIGNGTDPLVWAGNPGPEEINGVVFASWTAQQIADRINQVGIRGSGKDLNKVFKSLQDAQSGVPVYVLGATSQAGTPDDDTAVVAAIQANTALLAELLAATKKLNPPD